jgi:hypothetical protein
LELFLNRGNGRFERVATAAVLGSAADDQTTVLGLGGGEILVGQANTEAAARTV